MGFGWWWVGGGWEGGVIIFLTLSFDWLAAVLKYLQRARCCLQTSAAPPPLPHLCSPPPTPPLSLLYPPVSCRPQPPSFVAVGPSLNIVLTNIKKYIYIKLPSLSITSPRNEENLPRFVFHLLSEEIWVDFFIN